MNGKTKKPPGSRKTLRDWVAYGKSLGGCLEWMGRFWGPGIRRIYVYRYMTYVHIRLSEACKKTVPYLIYRF